MKSKPQWVWSEPTGAGRNVFVLFRRSFKLAAVPGSGEFHLFVDTRYRLRVNGRVVGYGPARFVPGYPEYDSYDLTPHLVKGNNAIVVEANSFGEKTFESILSTGGFVAWGTIRAGGRTIDLSTPGQWQQTSPDAWDRQSPVFSFAQGPVEVLDTGKLPDGLFGPGKQEAAWAPCVPIADASRRGRLRPRSIPHFMMDLHLPSTVLADAAIDQSELQFAATAHRPGGIARGAVKLRAAYAVCIHSPREQPITIGQFWGPHFLNGHEIFGKPHAELGNRIDYPVTLHQGWNVLYGEPEALVEPWSLLVGLPANAGLEVSADGISGDPNVMRYMHTARPEAELPRAAGRLPSTPADLGELGIDWQRLARGEPVGHPARLMGWTHAVPSTVARPQQVCDRTIPAGTDTVMVFDMGREFIGHVVLDVTAPAGTVIDVANDERVRANGLLGMFSHWMVNSVDRFVASGGRQTIEGFRPRGGRYLQVAVRHADGPVTLHSLQVRVTLVPLDVQGDFESSDPVFNWAWSAGVETIRQSFEDGWVDPWRERGLYLGDALVEHHATSAMTADASMIKRCLRLWSQGALPDGQILDVVPANRDTILHDYSLIYVILLHDYVAATGDVKLAGELFKTVENIMSSSAWEQAGSGLWNSDKLHVFIDWGQTGDERKGENGVLNAFRYRMLQCGRTLAEMTGRPGVARRLNRESRQVARAYQTLWDGESGRFAACRRSDGSLSDSPSLHANALALAYGLCTKPQVPAVLAYLKQGMSDARFLDDGRIELYFLYFLLEALYDLDETAFAEHLIRRHWGIMKDRGAWTMWETLERGLAGGGSQCHGWSCAPNAVFARRTLGVRVTPGKPSHVTIAPQSHTLSFARGVVPHPLGPIAVCWRVDGDQLQLSANGPRGVKLTIAPRGRLGKLKLRRI